VFFNAQMRGGRLKAIAAGTTATMAVAATAFGAHWSSHGGDVGRSGNQPVEPVGPPVGLEYSDDETSPVRTSIVTSGGADTSEQRVIYGTSDGRVHHRSLDTGAPAYSAKVVLSPQYSPDADVFGSGTGTVSPVSASDEDDLGYTFQVFNEDAGVADPTGPDIALSVFRQTDGTLVDTVTIPNTTNYTVNDSPILFQDALWFVATPDPNPQVPPQDPTNTPRLYKVNIGDPTGSAGNPTIGSTKTINVSGATSTAHPTGLYLKDADGNPKPYIALGFGSGNTVRTFSADTVDPAAGPASGDLAGGAAFTPSVPVLPNGQSPAPGEAVETAPYIYVGVSSTDPISDYPGSQVLKLTQKDGAPNTLVLAPEESNTSPVVIGNAGNTLAVSQPADQAPDNGGFVVMTTSCDVYSIAVGDMSDVEPLLGASAPDGCADATSTNLATGFRRTAAAVSGNLGFVQRNNGDQIAFTLDRADALPADQFEETDPQDATAAFGQPAISHRFVQFGDDKRVTVYSTGTELAGGEEGVGFAISDVNVKENAGKATFTITRSGTVGGNVTVTTGDGSATAGQDYAAVTGQKVTFTRAERTKTVDVPITNDITDEPDETFFARLSNPVGGGAHIVDGEGLGLISDDDTDVGALGIGITDVATREGSPAVFTVSLSRASTAPVKVNYATASGTAKAPADFTSAGGTLTFDPGQTAKSISVVVRRDRVTEPVERFTVNLSAPQGAVLSDPSGTALIANVRPSRVRPRRLTAKTTPKLDTTSPFTFVTTGKLVRPRSVSKRKACRGKVLVQVKSPKKTISARRVSLKRTCTYRSQVTFTSRNRFNSDGKLRFLVRFLGNADLKRRAARTQVVNTR
jgi:hypothetical protein